jgi:hypothetical protein|tara:strand:+ start:197 stop:469 length:273 start_codon:yes stop_codon:yes gene_type:complete
MRILEILVRENATAGATSAGNIATVTSPHIAIGPDRFKKSFTGSPGVSGTKAPKLPKITQPKNANGTAKGAHQLKGTSLFGGPIAKRSYP